MYALIDISNQMLEDSAFDMEGEIRGTVRAGQKSCRLFCAFVCLRQPYGILAPKDYQGCFSLRGSTCKGPRAGLRPANFPLPRRPADAFAGT
jgi:hypothetical protein